MKNSLKKRGQKFIRKFSKVSLQASEDSKEHIRENVFNRFSHIVDIRLLILEWGLLAIALIMLAVTQAFWFADSHSENVWASGGTFTEATLGDVNSMNPLFAMTGSEKTLSRLMFATLVTNDQSGHPIPALAKSVTPSEGGKIWTIKLRDDLKWSDNEPLTKDDVLFTLGLIKNSAVNTIYDTNLANVKITEGEDDGIVFTLSAPYADFISALNIPIIPKHILGDADPRTLIEDNFSNAPVTSGPFSFNAVQNFSFNNEKTVYLSNNPNYYKGSAMLNSFAVHTFGDHDSIISALNNGSVTATAELSEVDSSKITSSQVTQMNAALNSGAFMFMNVSSENLKDVELRKAIRQGINLEKIRSAAPDTIAINFPLLESQIKLENYPSIPNQDFDAAKAKVSELSGDKKISLEIATVNTGFLPDVSNVISEELKALGIDTHVSVYDENQEFISTTLSKRDYDILVYDVELGSDPDLLPYYHSSQAAKSGLNLSNYKNSLVDDLLLAGRETMDESLRIKKYESFLEYFVQDAPAIALYRPNLAYYYNKNVRPFSNTLNLSTKYDRFCDVKYWSVNTETKNKTP